MVPMGMKISMLQNMTLIVLILVGLFFWFPLHEKRKQLEKEYQTLSSTYGSFSDGQSSEPRIISLATDDPMIFRWRVHIPAGYTPAVLRAHRETNFTRNYESFYP